MQLEQRHEDHEASHARIRPALNTSRPHQAPSRADQDKLIVAVVVATAEAPSPTCLRKSSKHPTLSSMLTPTPPV